MNNTFWIIKDELAGRPGPIKAPWSLIELRNNGVDSILNLTNENDYENEAIGCGIRVGNFPLPDHYAATMETERLCRKILPKAYKYLREEIKDSHKVIVHCAWGQDRTGLLLAYYLCTEKQISSKEAIKIIREKQKNAITAVGWEDMACRLMDQRVE